MGGGAVAAARGRIVRAFARANAFDEAGAKSLEDLGLLFFARGMFARMARRGVIRGTADGRYYMDRGYYEARARRLRIVRPAALVLLAAVVVVVLCMAIFAR